MTDRVCEDREDGKGPCTQLWLRLRESGPTAEEHNKGVLQAISDYLRGRREINPSD